MKKELKEIERMNGWLVSIEEHSHKGYKKYIKDTKKVIEAINNNVAFAEMRLKEKLK